MWITRGKVLTRFNFILFAAKRIQKLSSCLASGIRDFIHLSGDFTPSSTPSVRGIPLTHSFNPSCSHLRTDELINCLIQLTHGI
jgi:hypothetical protein